MEISLPLNIKLKSKPKSLILSEAEMLLIRNRCSNLSINMIHTAFRYSWIIFENQKYTEYNNKKITKFMDCAVYLINKCFFLITHLFEISGEFCALGSYLTTEPVKVSKLGKRKNDSIYPEAISFKVFPSKNFTKECILLKFVSIKCTLHITDNEIDALSVLPNMLEID